MSAENVQEEINCGFICTDMSVALDQIRDADLESRKMGFISLINVSDDQNDLDNLYTMDVFSKLIASFDDINIPIIGMVCAAYRHIYSLMPDKGDEFAENLHEKYEFLLNLPADSEIIQFFSTLVDNSIGDIDYGHWLLSNEKFPVLLGEWLNSQNNDIIAAALGLLCSFTIMGPDVIDFSIATPFTDKSLPPNIRAQAFYVIYKAGNPAVIQDRADGLFSVLEQQNLGPEVFQIISDVIEENPPEDPEFIGAIINVCILNFNIVTTCNILAQLIEFIGDEQRNALIQALFSMKLPPVESLAFVFDLINSSGIQLEAEQVMALGKYFGAAENPNLMDLIMEMLSGYHEYLVSEDMQNNFVVALGRDFPIAVKALQFINHSLAQVPLTENLVEAYREFIGSNESKLQPMKDEIELFMQNHQ